MNCSQAAIQSALLFKREALQQARCFLLSAPSATLNICNLTLDNSNSRGSLGQHTRSQNRFWRSCSNSIPGLGDESRRAFSAGQGGLLQRGLGAFKKNVSRVRKPSAGAGQCKASPEARGREQPSPESRYLSAGLKMGAFGRVCAARLRRACARGRARSPGRAPRRSRKLAFAPRRRALLVLAGSVYLRDPRPPRAGAAAPLEPGPEV